MKNILVHLLGLFLAASLGCGVVLAEVSNRVVAFVNDDLVTLYELKGRIRALTGADPLDLREQDRARYAEIERRVLDLLIEEKIAQAKVRELGINVDDREVDGAVERIKKSNGWSDEELLYHLKREGVTLEAFREDLRWGLERNSLIDFEVKSRIVITEESLRQYYESNRESFSSVGEVRLAGIVLMFTDHENRREREAVLEQASDIMERLRAGESFADLAAKFSKGPGADQGGDLGVFSWSQLDGQILEAIENLGVGEISRPIVRPAGIQILKVIERRDEQIKPFEEVRGAIYDILYEQEMDARYNKWIEDLKQKAYIKRVL